MKAPKPWTYKEGDFTNTRQRQRLLKKLIRQRLHRLKRKLINIDAEGSLEGFRLLQAKNSYFDQSKHDTDLGKDREQACNAIDSCLRAGRTRIRCCWRVFCAIQRAFRFRAKQTLMNKRAHERKGIDKEKRAPPPPSSDRAHCFEWERVECMTLQHIPTPGLWQGQTGTRSSGKQWLDRRRRVGSRA